MILERPDNPSAVLLSLGFPEACWGALFELALALALCEVAKTPGDWVDVARFEGEGEMLELDDKFRVGIFKIRNGRRSFFAVQIEK